MSHIISKMLPMSVTPLMTLALLGCATTNTITPQYVSPSAYQQMNCTQLSQEHKRVTSLIDGAQKEQTPLSASGIGVGIAGGRHGIYPTISFGLGRSMGASSVKQTKLARLFGEHDAIVQAGRMGQCGFVNGIKIYGE